MEYIFKYHLKHLVCMLAYCMLLTVCMSCAKDDDEPSVPNLDHTVWREVDNYLTNENRTIAQITFFNGYATYAYVNRTTGVIDYQNDIKAHGRYEYRKEHGGFQIIDEKTGQPIKGIGVFRYEQGVLKYGPLTYVLYR